MSQTTCIYTEIHRRIKEKEIGKREIRKGRGAGESLTPEVDILRKRGNDKKGYNRKESELKRIRRKVKQEDERKLESCILRYD
jgi:hypothetical protein